MGFNCAQEKAKFDREWLRLRKEYTDAGMSETAIQKIYEYDWYCFCRNRAYERRATQMPSLEIDSPDDERRSALFRKNEALIFDSVGEVVSRAVSRWDSLRFPAGSIDVPQ